MEPDAVQRDNSGCLYPPVAAPAANKTAKENKPLECRVILRRCSKSGFPVVIHRPPPPMGLDQCSRGDQRSQTVVCQAKKWLALGPTREFSDKA